jgi:hypothetical protein
VDWSVWVLTVEISEEETAAGWSETDLQQRRIELWQRIKLLAVFLVCASRLAFSVRCCCWYYHNLEP